MKVVVRHPDEPAVSRRRTAPFEHEPFRFHMVVTVLASDAAAGELSRHQSEHVDRRPTHEGERHQKAR